MIRLILGLVRPENGEVKLRAANGKEIEMNAETRHLFAYVPQGNTILSGTIAENMRMVKEDATEEEIIEALKVACAWDFGRKDAGHHPQQRGRAGQGPVGGSGPEDCYCPGGAAEFSGAAAG